MIPGDNFLNAVANYLYLLDHGYPQKTILKLVGDHYALSANERTLLFRGATAHKLLYHRNQMKIETLPEKSTLTVDGFNIFRTVGSYLNGNFIFEGMDGFLRDASELHRQKLNWEILEKAIDLIVAFLIHKKCRLVNFYFDSPISHSGDLANLIAKKMQEVSLSGTAETVFSPDHILQKTEIGLICTSDSNIIDLCKVQVYDLSKGVLEFHFDPKIFSLKSYLNY